MKNDLSSRKAIYSTRNLINSHLNKQNKKILILISFGIILLLSLAFLCYLIKSYKIDFLVQINKLNKIEFFFNLNKEKINFILSSNKKFIHISSLFLVNIIIALSIFIAIIISLLVFRIYKNNKLEGACEHYLDLIHKHDIYKIDINMLHKFIGPHQSNLSKWKIGSTIFNFISKLQELQIRFSIHNLLDLQITHLNANVAARIRNEMIPQKLLKDAPSELKELYVALDDLIEEWEKIDIKLNGFCGRNKPKLKDEEEKNFKNQQIDLEGKIEALKKKIYSNSFYVANIKNKETDETKILLEELDVLEKKLFEYGEELQQNRKIHALLEKQIEDKYNNKEKNVMTIIDFFLKNKVNTVTVLSEANQIITDRVRAGSF